METRNYMVLYKLDNNSVIHTEYYVTEELARKDANELFQQGFAYIELFKKCHVGYISLKRVDQHPGVAKAKHDAFVEAQKQALLDYHKQLFG